MGHSVGVEATAFDRIDEWFKILWDRISDSLHEFNIIKNCLFDALELFFQLHKTADPDFQVEYSQFLFPSCFCLFDVCFHFVDCPDDFL